MQKQIENSIKLKNSILTNQKQLQYEISQDQ
jgi:hypothetical protein